MVLTATLVLTFVAGVKGDDPTVAEVTHWDLQAVDEYGEGTYAATDKVIITGIVLNNPEEIVNPTPATGYMGGQWQIYIQGESGDHAGTAVYLGQYYAKVGGQSGNYTDEQLISELCRINHDPNTGYTFAAGDRVRVTGWYKFYKGKINVNELHEADPMYDFEVELLEPAVGLPQPELITLNMVKDGNDQYIFDQTRLTGCEYYQARLVRVSDVNIVNPVNWAPDATITIVDGTGRTFPVKLGIGDGFSRYDCPMGQIDVIAIFDQENPSSSPPYYGGYRLWVPDYDGNGLVLTDRGHNRGNLPGDINTDNKVDFYDFAELADNWLKQTAGLSCCDE
jgi:hypothetical protein